MAKFGQLFGNEELKKTEAKHPRWEMKWLHYTKLHDNSGQYCDEKDPEEIIALADLIEADKGVLQNLLVRKIDADEYEIIAGHKRRRACRYLVEERGREQYAFLPCMVRSVSDVHAEFELYSSNGYHPKTDYERMHELERMQYLLNTYPEEFPELQTGRMVERLAKQMNMPRTTVGEYLSISKNLGEKGKQEFKEGNLKKSAALELAALPEKEQEELIEQGTILHKDIKAYKEKQQELKQHVEQVKKPKMEQESEEEQFPGQMTIADTDMSVTEIVSDFGTVDQTAKEETADSVVEVPESKGEDSSSENLQLELPRLKNDNERQSFLMNYKDWGVWYKDEHIGATYYKYDFPDGTRLIAETYIIKVNTLNDVIENEAVYMHLVGGPKERELNVYGLPKYPYHESYNRHEDNMTELLAFLKNQQK